MREVPCVPCHFSALTEALHGHAQSTPAAQNALLDGYTLAQQTLYYELVLLPKMSVQVLGFEIPKLQELDEASEKPHLGATMQALGRRQGNLDPQGILSVESLMDEIIDRAYDEDDEMGVRSTFNYFALHRRGSESRAHANSAVMLYMCTYWDQWLWLCTLAWILKLCSRHCHAVSN